MHHTKSGCLVAISTCLFIACGSVPLPRDTRVHAEDYVPVPYPPRTPPVEIVPERPPDTSAVWADGGWEWDGERYRWTPGAWVAPPLGARRAKWVVVRRDGDGQLFFAPTRWRDGDDKAIPAPDVLVRADGERRRSGRSLAPLSSSSSPPTDGGPPPVDPHKTEE